MRYSHLWSGLCGFLALMAAACSPLHTQVRPGFDWPAAADVALDAPETDSWRLVAAARQELQAMNCTTVPSAASPNPKLVVKLSWEEGPDFTSDGTLVTRPKSLHLQFIDPGDGTLVAVADYFLRSSEEPVAGLRAAFAGLRRELQTARAAAGQPVPRLSVEPPAARPADAPVAGLAEPVRPVAEQMPAPVAVEAAASPPAGVSAATPGATAPLPPAIRPLERSPWLPRFRSWGFDEWGADARPAE